MKFTGERRQRSAPCGCIIGRRTCIEGDAQKDMCGRVCVAEDRAFASLRRLWSASAGPRSNSWPSGYFPTICSPSSAVSPSTPGLAGGIAVSAGSWLVSPWASSRRCVYSPGSWCVQVSCMRRAAGTSQRTATLRVRKHGRREQLYSERHVAFDYYDVVDEAPSLHHVPGDAGRSSRRWRS